MKLQILSDLHNEVLRKHKLVDGHLWDGCIPETNADIIILAGDIDNGIQGVEWAIQESKRLSKPIIYVPGNHEYYHHEYFSVRQAFSTIQTDNRVFCLDNGVIESNNVRFIGATLWTDYEFYSGASREQAMAAIEGRLPDHRVISYKTEGRLRNFTPDDALTIHRKELGWIKQQLTDSYEGKTVVVTHHGPHPLCQHAGYPENEISSAFHSDLSKLIEQHDIDLWVYGHTHSNLDVTVSDTHIVSNQAGYPGENVQGFKAGFTVTI